MINNYKEKTETKRIQTRRSIHISSETYDRISEYAAEKGTSRSQVLERAINTFFDGAPQ